MSECPCCSGATNGDFFDLCEICTVASLEGRFPHDCDRISDPPATTPDTDGDEKP